MTNEQRKAIDRLKDDIKYADMRDTVDDDCTICFIDDLDTVLSLIKKQQEEIENTKELYDRALSDLVKADKQIDLMAELVYKRFKAELLLEYGFENEEQLKQYFERKVEE